MNERIETFEVGESPTITVRVAAGTVRIAPGDAGTVVVRLRGKGQTLEAYQVVQTGDLIEVAPSPGRRGLSSLDVIVETGAVPEVRARLGSCDLAVAAPLAALQVEGASGDIRVEHVAGDVVARCASGDIRIGTVGGSFKASLASGDVVVEAVDGGMDVKTASGDVKARAVAGGFKAKSASGDVVVGDLRSGDLDATSLSGDVIVGIPAGRTLEVNLNTVSGRVTTEFPVRSGGEDPADGSVSSVTVRTISGDVLLKPAS